MKPATTIVKVCRVLNEFRDRPSIGVTELARHAGLLPSDVHRILASLQSYGFVEQNSHTKTYRLGVSVLKLGLAAFQRCEMREAALPLLRRLSDEMDASAHMAIYDGRELEIFLAEQVETREKGPLRARLGSPAAAHCTALGKIVIANMERDTARRLVHKHGMPRITLRTITGLPELEAELDRIRRVGYALDLEENTRGACCIGAPVCDGSGAIVGAISVSMLASRFYGSSEAELARRVKATAEKLCAAISSH